MSEFEKRYKFMLHMSEVMLRYNLLVECIMQDSETSGTLYIGHRKNRSPAFVAF